MSEAGRRAKKVKENVYHILEEHPETRNDDRLLMLRYWNMYDDIAFDETFPVLFATRGTSPESIRRARQLIQQHGDFPPTLESIQQKRGKLQEELREHYAGR